MKKKELFERGHMLLDDASFLSQYVIPLALKDEKWNLAHFHAYLAVEQTLKGLYCLSGHEFKQTHNIDELAQRLSKILPAVIARGPFVCTVHLDNNIHFGVRIEGNLLTLLEVEGGSYIQRAGYIIDSIQAERLTIRMDKNKITISNDDTQLVSYAAVRGYPQGFESQLARHVDPDIVDTIKKAGEELLKSRTKALYWEKQLTKSDAQRAIKLMDSALDAIGYFYHAEFIQNSA